MSNLKMGRGKSEGFAPSETLAKLKKPRQKPASASVRSC